MKIRILIILLIAGLSACQKNVDTLSQTLSQPNQPSQTLPASFISSDTIVENEILPDGRTYVTKKYWITSVSPVKEGSSLSIKMNTTNVPKGTILSYSITGIDTNDITTGKLNGNFIISSNGKDSVSYTIKADNKTEGTENMKVTAKGATLSISITDASVDTLVTVAPQSSAFTLEQIPYGDIDLLAPGRGANTFYTYTQAVNVPEANTNTLSMDNDARYTWIQLQPGTSASSFNWSAFDSDINYSISKGQRFSFRVMTLDTDALSYNSQTTGGNKITYPLFVHNAMQAEATKDWLYNGSWIPNWNSPAYLSAWETFLKAVADHINTGSYNGVAYKNAIYHIDLSGFGNYGEFHSYPFINSYPSAALKMADASFKRIVDAHTSAFPNIPLIGNINMFVGEMTPYAGWYALTASNAWGKFGIRSDHLGDNGNFNYDTKNNTRTYNGLSFKDEILNRWKSAPLLGEPMNDANKVMTGGSCYFWDFENEVRTYHMSQFSNQNGIGQTTACLQENYRNASKASGYRLSLTGGSINGSTVTLNWNNSGIAPVYENWDVYLELRNGNAVVWSGMTSFKPKSLLPGIVSATTTMGTVGSGNYSLYVIVKDPVGYRKPLPLANKNRLTDGSYKLADIKI